MPSAHRPRPTGRDQGGLPARQLRRPGFCCSPGASPTSGTPTARSTGAARPVDHRAQRAHGRHRALQPARPPTTVNCSRQWFDVSGRSSPRAGTTRACASSTPRTRPIKQVGYYVNRATSGPRLRAQRPQPPGRLRPRRGGRHRRPEDRSLRRRRRARREAPARAIAGATSLCRTRRSLRLPAGAGVGRGRTSVPPPPDGGRPTFGVPRDIQLHHRGEWRRSRRLPLLFALPLAPAGAAADTRGRTSILPVLRGKDRRSAPGRAPRRQRERPAGQHVL